MIIFNFFDQGMDTSLKFHFDNPVCRQFMSMSSVRKSHKKFSVSKKARKNYFTDQIKLIVKLLFSREIIIAEFCQCFECYIEEFLDFASFYHFCFQFKRITHLAHVSLAFFREVFFMMDYKINIFKGWTFSSFKKIF